MDGHNAPFYGELLLKDTGQKEVSVPGVPSIDGAVNGSPVPSFRPIRSEVRFMRIPGTGVLYVAGTKFHMAPGFRMKWRTFEFRQELKQPIRSGRR